jgi:hypothetical protein
MVDSETNLEPKLLGAGCSGQVFLISTPSGKIARKIFSGDRLAKIVHYFFFGADNAYIWNEDFLKCAYYRRKILDFLAQYWFASKLKIASAIDTGWHEELKLNILDTEFIDTFTQIGEKIPIWGGEDTLTEHYFNHWAERVVNWIGFMKRRSQS